MELAGNKYKFTIFIIVMNLFLWINVSVLNYSLAFIETKPKVTYIKDNKDNFKPMKIKGYLTLKKEKVNDIIKGIKNVNKFSDEKRCY